MLDILVSTIVWRIWFYTMCVNQWDLYWHDETRDCYNMKSNLDQNIRLEYQSTRRCDRDCMQSIVSSIDRYFFLSFSLHIPFAWLITLSFFIFLFSIKYCFLFSHAFLYTFFNIFFRFSFLSHPWYLPFFHISLPLSLFLSVTCICVWFFV